MIATWGELLGHGSVGSQTHGAAIQQGEDPAAPTCGGTQVENFASLQAQGLVEEGFGQALAGVAIGGGGGGRELAGKARAQGVGAAVAGVGQGGLQAVVRIEALKEQIPEGDQRREEPLVEALGLEGGESGQGAGGQQLEEEGQQLPRCEGGQTGLGLGFPGVFLEYALYVNIIIYIQCMLYSLL
ncbi:MAG: hypothetical protein AUG75_19050 [Cyanobacteria bacterium 13_1_20CM_4_61_6]|nr:MAG: hypothetical protein AUG75_19050 [Cyanobacteria bacterium 13_1_20CM_4_61_6]